MNSRDKTEEKVFAYIKEHHMIAPGEKIVVGVSGGADSVCLLFLLLACAERIPLSLAVVHVNHGIRDDAEADARYVETLCRQNGIPFFLTSLDVRTLAAEEKCSEEDAGRRGRYRAFRRAAEELGGAEIAVAHNSDDNAETMLFHLFRGTGIKGLGGIPPVRAEEGGLKIIRPILCLERKEVEAYLSKRQIAWRTDCTNCGDDYRRNRIRHHILPYAECEIAEGTVEHMRRTAQMLRETESFLEQQTWEAMRKCVRRYKKGAGTPETEEVRGYVVEVEEFRQLHSALQKRIVFELICRLSPGRKDISFVHIRDTLNLFVGEEHRRVSLPFGIAAWRQYGQVFLTRGVCAADSMPMEKTVPLTEELFTQPAVYDLGNRGQMEFYAFFRKKEQEVPRNQYTKWFDYDKMKESLTIRSRLEGDFLTIADGTGNMVHKSLKKYMVTEKIPRQLRDEIPVLAEGNHVLWLTGRRISEYFKVDENTKRVLQVKLCRGYEDHKTEEENGGTH